MCKKLDVPFLTSEKLGFLEKLVKDNCLSLLDLGNVVYPHLMQLFYTNLETKSTPKGMILMSTVKAVEIILSRFVLVYFWP